MLELKNLAIPDIPLPPWEEVSKIPIIESNEKLQPATLASHLWRVYPIYFKMMLPHAVPECFLRMGVYKRLLKVASLLPETLTLVVLDGWRDFALQQHLFDTLVEIVKLKHPERSLLQIKEEVRSLVSPPSVLSSSPSPHLTGGAVDVTLCDKNGVLLDMGTVFDEASPWSYTASYEGINTPNDMQINIRNNRRLLYNAMISAGFTNLSSEWWHFDFGDQLWAWYSGNKNAQYGATNPDSLEKLWQ